MMPFKYHQTVRGIRVCGFYQTRNVLRLYHPPFLHQISSRRRSVKVGIWSGEDNYMLYIPTHQQQPWSVDGYNTDDMREDIGSGTTLQCARGERIMQQQYTCAKVGLGFDLQLLGDA